MLKFLNNLWCKKKENERVYNKVGRRVKRVTWKLQPQKFVDRLDKDLWLDVVLSFMEQSKLFRQKLK